MQVQKLKIGHPLRITVHWYDKVPEPPKLQDFEGEIVGWRETQVIIRVKDYAVLRFWKRNGLEVGNSDHERRGFRVDLPEIAESIKTAKGVEVPIAIDTERRSDFGEVPSLPQDPQ
jgi:hypothetical protein